MPKTIRTDRAREKFLAVLQATCNVSESCRAANISRPAAYAWRGDDEDFAVAWADAEAQARDLLEREAWRRATEGWEEPVFHKGEVCGAIRRYSDRMLEILLKGHKPERFVEKRVLEHSGPDGGPIQVSATDLVQEVGDDA